MSAKERWVCPKCGFVYVSPTKIAGISHRCPSERGFDAVALRKQKGKQG